MLKSPNPDPLVRFIAIVILIVIGVLISMQGFHHHDSLEEERSCKWHNIIPAAFIMMASLVIMSYLRPADWVFLEPTRIEGILNTFLMPDLLDLPPPASH